MDAMANTDVPYLQCYTEIIFAENYWERGDSFTYRKHKQCKDSAFTLSVTM